MPYLDELLAAYRSRVSDQPALSLAEARDAMVRASSAQECGAALAGLACALVRDSDMSGKYLSIDDFAAAVRE